MRPMLASPTTVIPEGDEWLHEVKWDGMRVLADVHDGRADPDVPGRERRDGQLPGAGCRLADAFDDMLLDGEVVALDGGRPSFGALADRMHVKTGARRSGCRRCDP